jgi:hypothetical protein
MGKRPEDLNVDDTPLDSPRRRGGSDDARETEWYRFILEIDDLLATGEYTWAQQTLEGIQETVEKTERVSEGQRHAVENIAAGGRKSRGRSRPNYFRRYQ